MKKILPIFIILFTFSFPCLANDSDIFNSKTRNKNIDLDFPFGFLQVPLLNINTNFYTNSQKIVYFQNTENKRETLEKNNSQEITPLDFLISSVRAFYLLTDSLPKHYAEAPHEKRQREYEKLSY